MEPSTRDEIEGKVHEVKGKVKEKAGQTDEQSRLGSRRSGRKHRRESPKENRPSGEDSRQIVVDDSKGRNFAGRRPGPRDQSVLNSTIARLTSSKGPLFPGAVGGTVS
jgi:hypothetical protein